MTKLLLFLLMLTAHTTLASVELKLSTIKSSYEMGEPIYLTLRLENGGDTQTAVWFPMDPALSTVAVRIVRPDRTLASLPSGYILGGETVDLAPGEEIGNTIPIFQGLEGWIFDTPGRYRIQARHASTEEREITVEIQANAKLSAILRETAAIPAGHIMVWHSRSPELDAGAAWLRKALNEFPNTALADHARIALAGSSARPFRSPDPSRTRLPDCLATSRYLGDLARKELPKLLQYHEYLARYRCGEGEGEDIDSLINRMRDLTQASELSNLAQAVEHLRSQERIQQ